MSDDTQTSLIEAVIEARELVQELHGQIKDATRLRRELAEANTQLGRTAEEVFRRVADEHAAKLEQTMTDWALEVKKVIAQTEATLRERAAELAGLKTPEEFMNTILDGLKVALLNSVNDRAEEIVRELNRHKRRRLTLYLVRFNGGSA